MAPFRPDEAFLERVRKYYSDEGIAYVSGLHGRNNKALSVSDAFEEISNGTDLGRVVYALFHSRYPELAA